MPKQRKKYTRTKVVTELEEIVNPQFSPHRGGGRPSHYRDLLAKVQKHPKRWFVVARFAYANAPDSKSYEYVKPYILVSRLNKRFGAEGFVFRTLTGDDAKFPNAALVRTVVVQYSAAKAPSKADQRRIKAIKEAKELTKKAGPK